MLSLPSVTSSEPYGFRARRDISGLPSVGDAVEANWGLPALIAKYGEDGRDGVNGAAWFSGSVAPVDSAGINGDFYFRTSNATIWTKADGAWSATGGH